MKSKQFSIRMFIFGIAALIICVVIAYLLKPKYPVYMLNRDSQYLISFSPNIYKKEFLLKVLARDESPWACEIEGTRRIRKIRPMVYAQHINGWYLNTHVQ